MPPITRMCLKLGTHGRPAPEAQLLRKRFIFMLVPMMNPDGVINGNYRTSLIGKDLNRQWLKPSEATMPSVYALKKLLHRLGSEKDASLDIFCDLHGPATTLSRHDDDTTAVSLLYYY